VKPGWLLIFLLIPAIVQCARKDMAPSIQEVKVKHEQRLMDIEGVVSVGLGRDKNGSLAIIVGVDRPVAEIAEPLPQALDGYPVIVQVIGTITPQ
jgi:hypothetical protein